MFLWKNPRGLYFYRYTIPQHLKPYFTIGTIKRSLGTTSDKAASIRAAALHIQVLSALDKIANMTDSRRPKRLVDLLNINPLKVEVDGAKFDFDLNNPIELAEYQKLVQSIQKGGSAARSVDTESATERLLERIEAITTPNTIQGKSKTFQDVKNEYLIHAKAKNLAPRTQKQYASKIERFEAWLGKKPTPINAISAARFHEFKTYLMTGDEANKPLAAKTVDLFTGAINEVFKMAVHAGYIATNPCQGQLVIKRKVRQQSETEKFTDDDLKLIFDPKRLNQLEDPSDVWVPLLGLFTGARLNEICQLKTADIQQDQGFWLLDFHNSGEDNNLKTSASERKIPIHPRLIKLGFLDYIEAVKALPESNGRIFPWLRKYEQAFGDVPSQRFQKILQALGIWVFRRKVFHSFRHTAQVKLQQSGIDLVVRKHWLGHETNDITVDTYGEETPLKILADSCFPALNFEFIKWEKIDLDTDRITKKLTHLNALRNKKPI